MTLPIVRAFICNILFGYALKTTKNLQEENESKNPEVKGTISYDLSEIKEAQEHFYGIVRNEN